MSNMPLMDEAFLTINCEVPMSTPTAFKARGLDSGEMH